MSALCESYEKQLKNLPRGSLQIKERKQKQYFYLTYRFEGRVVSNYLGNNEVLVVELKEQLKRRKDIEALLKNIKKELVLMNKALEMAK